MSRGTFLVRSVHGGDITVVDAHSDRSFARHAHDTFGIGLITEGAQRSWSGRGAVEAACGQLITVNPGEVHDGKPVGPARSWSMLYLSPRLVGDIIADATEGRIAVRELHQPVEIGRAHVLTPVTNAHLVCRLLLEKKKKKKHKNYNTQI